ncbi:MAG: helix-turn-helix transcriptional regulator [Nitratireductor sp.]|nr:helix-turn-helix transcriptional regulator [Nitratireductor sp.]
MRQANQIDVQVGANVRRHRLLERMTQGALGAELGLTFQQVQKYEKGANRISASKLVAIARVLRCTLADLFEGVALESVAPDAPTIVLPAGEVEIAARIGGKTVLIVPSRFVPDHQEASRAEAELPPFMEAAE